MSRRNKSKKTPAQKGDLQKGVEQKETLYDVLSVSKNASADQIRSAYKKRALECHPDRKGGNAEQFRRVSEAYEILSDAEKREHYDMNGTIPTPGQGPTSNPWGGTMPGGFEGGASGIDPAAFFQHMFREMFTNAPDPNEKGEDDFARNQKTQHQRRVQRGHDVAFELDLPYKDLYHGVTKKLAIRRKRRCKACRGSGVVCEDVSQIECMQCHGGGTQVIMHRTMWGEQRQQMACTFCGGEGIKPPISMPKCSSCSGAKIICERAIFEVVVKPGMHENGQIICKEQGDESLLVGEGMGDVILTVSSTLPPNWKRRGQNLVHEMDVSLGECLTGLNRKVIEHPAGHLFAFSINQVIMPTKIIQEIPVAVWVALDQGMPAFEDADAGNAIIVLRIQYPTFCIDKVSLPSELLDTFSSDSSQSDAPQDVAENVVRPALTHELSELF